ncbi:MAG: DUF4926 domain-containing protein [Candidatus Electrothrix sp. AUS4]|nr:DUF4926 domain-containing protein [Candidatus Electrothrix sp. AUS4]
MFILSSQDLQNTSEITIVILVEDLSEHGFFRGQVGTVVEMLAPDVYEVEFTDEEGQMYAMQAL